MYGLYSVMGVDEFELITASEELFALMKIADEREEFQFFLIKKVVDVKGENPQEIWGARIGWTDDVLWRRKNQHLKRKRDFHVFKSLGQLIKRGKGD